MSKIITHQVKYCLKQKEAVFTMILLTGLVIANYLGNVFDFQGRDVADMYHPMKLLVLSYNKVNYKADIALQLVMLFPFLVVLPAGFSYVKEQQTGEAVLITSRIGKKRYLLSKLCAAFITTVIVFFVPFIMEIIMNIVSFPLGAQGDFLHMGIYDKQYTELVRGYMFSDLYIYSPYLHAVFMTLFFSIFAGIVGMFTVAVSYAIRIPYRALLFLPSFLLLNGTRYLDDALKSSSLSFTWDEYLLFHFESGNSIWCFILEISVILFVTGAAYLIGKKKEV